MQQPRYKFIYTYNKRQYEYFRDAVVNTQNLLTFIERQIDEKKDVIENFTHHKLNKTDDPYFEMDAKSFCMQDAQAIHDLWTIRNTDTAKLYSIMPIIESFLRMQLERDKLIAKLEWQSKNMEAWEDRITVYAPVFEKESTLANENFDNTWKKAEKYLAEHPEHIILGMTLTQYPKEDQNNPETFSQDLKNQAYKTMVAQLAFAEKQKGMSSMKKI